MYKEYKEEAINNRIIKWGFDFINKSNKYSLRKTKVINFVITRLRIKSSSALDYIKLRLKTFRKWLFVTSFGPIIPQKSWITRYFFNYFTYHTYLIIAIKEKSHLCKFRPKSKFSEIKAKLKLTKVLICRQKNYFLITTRKQWN